MTEEASAPPPLPSIEGYAPQTAHELLLRRVDAFIDSLADAQLVDDQPYFYRYRSPEVTGLIVIVGGKAVVIPEDEFHSLKRLLD